MDGWAEVVAAAGELLGRDVVLLGPTERGESGTTARATVGDDEVVLKVVAPNPHGLDDARRLLRLTDRLRRSGSPVPEHLGAGTTARCTFTVQRTLPGRTFEPGPGVRPEREVVDRLLPQLLAAVELQRDAGDLAGPPWPGWMLETIERGGDGYCLHETMRARPDTAALLDRLVALAARARDAAGPPRTTDVVHFDLSPANVLHVDGYLTGIVDWNVPFAGAAQGDRGFDVATLLFYLYDDETARPVLWDAAVALSGPSWVVVFLCHLVLRQVEWSARHRPGSPEEARFLRIAAAVLDDADALHRLH